MKTPGQTAYEEDLRRQPLYHDGGRRPSWAELDPWARPSWEKNPTPRDMRHLQPATR